MNYDLAMMALDGLTQARIDVTGSSMEVVIEGSAPSLRELARLLLLLGGEGVAGGEEVELRAGVHLSPESPSLRLRKRPEEKNG